MFRRLRLVVIFLLLGCFCTPKEDPVEKAKVRDSVPTSEFYRIAKKMELPKNPAELPGELASGESVKIYPPGIMPIVVTTLEFIAVNFRKVITLDMGLLDRKDFKVDSSGIVIPAVKEALDELCKPLETGSKEKICALTVLIDKKVSAKTSLAVLFTAASSFGNKLYLAISPRQNEIGVVQIYPPRISTGLARIYDIAQPQGEAKPPQESKAP